MQLKGKLIYSVNEAIRFWNNPLKCFRAVLLAIVSTVPASARLKLNRNKYLRRFYRQLIESYKLIVPDKVPRVYIRKGIARMEFFDILNQRNIDYVLLRWWHELPWFPDGEDMDILIKDEHRELISDLLTFHDTGSGLKCDIYTAAGSGYGSHRGIPYFQSNLAQTLIETRISFRGTYVPSPLPYFASLAYHALFHKGHSSGLPGFALPPASLEHNYALVLQEHANSQGIDVDVSVAGLYKWLKEKDFAPADDTLSKIVERRPELSILQKNLYCDIRGGELLVFVVRERLVRDGLLSNFVEFLKEKYQFAILDMHMLKPEEQKICAMHIRGGKWDKGPFTYSGGRPASLVVAFDDHPWPLETEKQVKQPRMTDRNNLMAKYEYRDLLKRLLLKGDYNGVHSADNELDAWAYIELLGEAYHLKIMDEVERIRNSNASFRMYGKKRSNVCETTLENEIENIY